MIWKKELKWKYIASMKFGSWLWSIRSGLRMLNFSKCRFQANNEEFGKVYEYVLIADGEQGMGTLRLNCDHEDFAKIERVAVIPEKQYKGYGRLLMAEAEAWIKDKGYKKIVIHSKYSASGFYEKLGYTMDEHIELDFGPDEKRQVYFSKEWD